MARKKTTAPMKHSILKCQVRLAVAKAGVRVQVTAAPDTPVFSGVRIWPEPADKERELMIKGGAAATTNFQVEQDEDFWLEISYGGGKKSAVQIKYEHRRPFGYKAAKIANPAKVDLGGSVPRLRPVR